MNYHYLTQFLLINHHKTIQHGFISHFHHPIRVNHESTQHFLWRFKHFQNLNPQVPQHADPLHEHRWGRELGGCHCPIDGHLDGVAAGVPVLRLVAGTTDPKLMAGWMWMDMSIPALVYIYIIYIYIICTYTYTIIYIYIYIAMSYVIYACYNEIMSN